MSLTTPELLDAVSNLATIREMKVAVNVSAQCGLIAAVTTMAGGLLGGPRGIALGGLLGAGIASYHANGKFKSVPEILAEEATPDQKEKLATALKNLLTAEKIFTLVELVTMLQNDRMLIQAIQNVIRQFFISDMGYSFVT